jgi:hypothetical protein
MPIIHAAIVTTLPGRDAIKGVGASVRSRNATFQITATSGKHPVGVGNQKMGGLMNRTKCDPLTVITVDEENNTKIKSDQACQAHFLFFCLWHTTTADGDRRSDVSR